MPSDRFQIKPDCKRCPLHKGTRVVCMRGANTGGHRPLVIFTDYPDYFAEHAKRPYALHTGKILKWMLESMSIDPEKVGFDYTLRCYAQKTEPSTKAERAVVILKCNKYRFASIAKMRPKAIVVLGNTTLEAFTGKTKAGDYDGCKVPVWEGVVRDYVPHVWVSYGLNYILFKGAGETQNVFRTIFMAAKEAGLNPKINPHVPPFKWPDTL